MHFYNCLQLDVGVLKSKIRSAETSRERHKFQIALVSRALLIVLFAIALIAPLTAVFGSENNAMTVALFCILLSTRFVDFGYCVRDSLISMGVVFALLLGAPIAASMLHPIFALAVHFAAVFTILVMTCDQPEMGNGGLYAFSYVFLAANPVTGALLVKRSLLTLLGFIVCGTIFFVKHRRKHVGIRFRQILSQFHLSSEKSRWQLRLALGVSLLLFLSVLLKIERYMWAGFA